MGTGWGSPQGENGEGVLRMGTGRGCSEWERGGGEPEFLAASERLLLEGPACQLA